MINDASRRAREALEEFRKRRDGLAPILTGLGAGGAGLLVSYGLRGGNLGRPLGDPVPLILVVTQLPNGFTYFPWRPALYHLIFAVLLGSLAFVALVILEKGNVTRSGATRAGRIAVLMNVLVVAALQVDAVVIGFWYLISGLVTVIISGLVAGLAFSSYANWRNRRIP